MDQNDWNWIWFAYLFFIVMALGIIGSELEKIRKVMEGDRAAKKDGP